MRVAALMSLIVASGLFAACSDGDDDKSVPPPAPNTIPSPSPTPAEPAGHPFTGRRKGGAKPVLAVKIDNTRPAHPQQGLRSADIVYAEQVEGGQTRLMAIFSSKLPKTVGPVRSARISDLHVLRQFGRPALAYSGVQSKMVPEVRRAPLFDVSPDYAESAYSRASGRSAPYNLFASPRRLLARAPKASKAKKIGFRFGDAPEGGKKMRSYTARWPSDSMTFRWSPAKKRWLVWHYGSADMAAEGGQLGGRTIVIQRAKTTRSRFHDSNGSYTPLIHTTGKGKALVLRDGRAYPARWSRRSERKGTTFTTRSGEPMTFARGQVWVVLVNDGKPVSP